MCFVNERNYLLLLTFSEWKRAKILLLLFISSEINTVSLKVLISPALAVQYGSRSFLQGEDDFFKGFDMFSLNPETEII